MATTAMAINNQMKTFVFDQQPINNAWVFNIYATDGRTYKECEYVVRRQRYKDEVSLVCVPEGDKNNLPAWVFEDESIFKISNEIKRIYQIPEYQ
jgi:hypothetical protein